MNPRTLTIAGLGLAAATALGGCGTTPKKDYTNYLAHLPTSILVLPPVNHTANVDASDIYLSTVTTSLADHGYYVFPVAVIDQLFKSNGMPTPGDMHNVSLVKVREVLGADAVLYVEILSWETQYAIFATSSEVRLRYKLVDVDTGTVLWTDEQAACYGQSGIIEAAVDKAMAELDGRYRQLATTSNAYMATDLIAGPRSPKHEASVAKARATASKHVSATN